MTDKTTTDDQETDKLRELAISISEKMQKIRQQHKVRDQANEEITRLQKELRQELDDRARLEAIVMPATPTRKGGRPAGRPASQTPRVARGRTPRATVTPPAESPTRPAEPVEPGLQATAVAS